MLSQLQTICDYIMQANVDLVFLCETWLQPKGDEADCAALTLPGFCLKSFHDSLMQVVGLLFYIEPVLQKALQFLLEILFLLLLRYVKCVFPMMVILQCSLVFTVPHLVDKTRKQMK